MRYFAIFLLLLALAGGYCAYDAHRFLTTPADLPGTDVHLEVERGATFDRVAWDLKKAGLITDVKRFQLYARYKKALGSIKAGEYILNSSLTPPQILEQLVKGQAHLVRLTIREGLPWWETAKAIEKQGFATFDDFKAIIHDPEFLARHAIPFDNAEGFLFPDTYLLNKPKSLDREQAEYIASLLVRTFWKKNTPFWQLLDASPAPDEDFGASVNDITSKSKIMTLPELAHYSHEVVMRAPLPQAEEFEAAYGHNGQILEDMLENSEETTETDDADETTATPENHKIPHTANESDTSSATETKEKATPDTPTTERSAKGLPTANASAVNGRATEKASSSALPKVSPKASPKTSPDKSSDDVTKTDNKAHKKDAESSSPENLPQKPSKADSTSTQEATPLPSAKENDTPKETTSSQSSQTQAKATTDGAKMPSDTPAHDESGTTSSPNADTPQNDVTGQDAGTKEPSPPETSKATATNGGTAPSGQSLSEKGGKNAADKNSTLLSGGGATTNAETSQPPALPDIWPAGALPQHMPKHPPKTPAEIDKNALRQALTLASLVEKETGLPTERPRVAGVYANRMTKNMLLQCDPTIIYGIGPDFSGPIRRSQLRDATNLYNTYIHAGLPPSPICSFGVDAFASALLPEKHDYLFFVATGKGKDHTFSKTLREHNRAVRVYRARMRNK